MQIENAVRAYATRNRTAELAALIPGLRRNGGEDLQTALLLMKLLEDTDPELKSELGDCYYRGDGVSRNAGKALSLFQAAAAGGSLGARCDLGRFYYDRGEYLRAIEQFAECISRKSELDDQRLGSCYACLGDAYTKISEPKLSTAIENLAVAADRFRHGFACRRLGMIYSEVGAQQFDAEKAVRYFELGAACGDSESAHRIASGYLFGSSELQLARNGRKAEELLLRFADSGDAEIMKDLGLLYQHGDEANGVRSDNAKARHYYECAWSLSKDPQVASDLGYVYFRLGEYYDAEPLLLLADQADRCEHSAYLGRIYRDGLAGQADLAKAEFYYERAYAANALDDMYSCAEYIELLKQNGKDQRAYELAEYGEKTFNEIWFLFTRAELVLSGRVQNRISTAEAAEMMEVCTQYQFQELEAHLLLGDYYYNSGEFRKAEKHYMDAYGLGCADAGAYLGRLYEYGGGTINADPNKAYAWYTSAADAGSELGRQEAACFRKGMFGGYRRRS